ncbi:MAG: tRNA (adenosine(37)-N6)-dimethylallyltransferase MiaA [Gudongella sp.]|jgi:tRNA dimethylallyltransferase|nr:tRNA (adenosine(37)-N6)-dimethylallyltransferase MiaA [Gudongella sp.]
MKERLVIITGPTAVGKTATSIAVAKALDGEIISADSMQIYKYMDIGTAKATVEEMEGIPHHMTDILTPDEDYSVALYSRMAKEKISELNERGKLPIVVGGTGLYINSLVYNLDFGSVPPQPDYRSELYGLYEEKGGDYLLDMLKKVDPVYAESMGPKDVKRIVRALEVFKITGERQSERDNKFREENTDYLLSYYCLNMDRQKLYDRIDKRVDIMLADGLVEEVKGLLASGYTKQMTSMQGIGYKEVCDYLDGNCTLDEAVELIKKGSRNYAKRQLTWFRRDNRIKWIDVDKFDEKADLNSFLIEDIRNNIFY